MRLIDADALVKDGYVLHRTYQQDEKTMVYETKRIEDIPTAQPEPKWILCQDRLPEEAQECWIAAKDGTVWSGMFTRRYGERRDSGFICYGCGFAWLNAVTAWMPYELPEPYKENK